MRQGLINSVAAITVNEQVESMRKFPLFSSTHEGYAVILEEVEEAREEVEYIVEDMNIMWLYIKANDTKNAMYYVEKLKRRAISAACEMVQVAAMAQKFIESVTE